MQPAQGVFAQRQILEGLKDLAGESEADELARLRFADSPGAHVEQHIGVELPHRGAVAALDVVGVDLKLGLVLP